MKINYYFTPDDGIKACLGHIATRRGYRLWRRYGISALSVLFFGLLAPANLPSTGHLIIGSTSYPTVNNALAVITLLPFSALYAWGTHALLRYIGRRSVQRQVSQLPAQLFGLRSITLSDDGILFTTPATQSRHDWNMVRGTIETREFIFIQTKLSPSSVPCSAFASDEEKLEFLSAITTHVADAEKAANKTPQATSQ
jgi:hypothetical protein